jgi:O-antigen/teichoic acid export membrane protein
VKRLLRFGSYVVLGTVTGVIYIHANRILVGRILGTAAVTYFAVPWNVSARIAHLVATLTEAITPVASGLAVQDAAPTLRSLYWRSTRLVAITGATVAVPLFVAAPDLLVVWMGTAFAERSAATLRILAVSAFVQGLGAAPYFILNGIGRPAAANLPTVAGAAVNIALAFALTPSHGIGGAAAAIVIGLSLQTALLAWAADRVLEMPRSVAWSLARPLAAAALALAAGLGVAPHVTSLWPRFVGECTMSVLTLHVILVVTGCYDRKELAFLWRAVFSGARPTADGGAKSGG